MASDANTPPTVHDPDFDAPRVAVRRPRGPVFVPQETQRLLANPFLMVTLFLFGLWGLGLAERQQSAPGFVIALLVLSGSVFFLHYHCLDCGATGRLFRWRRHECERVLVRRITGQVRRLRGPTPTMQTILWGYLLLCLWVLSGIVFLTRS